MKSAGLSPLYLLVGPNDMLTLVGVTVGQDGSGGMRDKEASFTICSCGIADARVLSLVKYFMECNLMHASSVKMEEQYCTVLMRSGSVMHSTSSWVSEVLMLCTLMARQSADFCCGPGAWTST
eukprot:5444456-Ditylum_brightwellii.AAC.1